MTPGRLKYVLFERPLRAEENTFMAQCTFKKAKVLTVYMYFLSDGRALKIRTCEMRSNDSIALIATKARMYFLSDAWALEICTF